VISATPVLHEDKWLYQVTHEKTPYILALDKKTGKELWKVPRKTDAIAECEHAYTSPILYTDGNGTQLVSHGSDYVIGYEIATGRELWRSGGLQTDPYHKTLRFIASPTAVPGQIVVPSAKNQMIISVNPQGAAGDITKTEHFQWSIPKGTPDVPCPLIHDGIVYICREKSGIVNTYEAKTGKEIYTERIHGGLYRASPVYADGNIYLTCRDGTITVIRAGRTFKQVSENVLDGDAMTASPAISEGVIYLHTHKGLYAVK
jgi:outer membrane protein assembly factor BamB